MSEKLWVKMAEVFYNKDAETAERMGVENFFNKAASKMIAVVAESVEGEEKLYLEEQSKIAEAEQRL